MPDQAEGGLLGGQAAELAEDALRIARRARGVVHDVADGAVGRVGGRLGVAHARRRSRSPAMSPTAKQIDEGSSASSAASSATSANRSWADERLGPGVRQDVGDLGADQVVVDGHQVPAGLQGGEVELEHLDAVGQHVATTSPGCRSMRPQAVDHLVGPARAARRRCTRCRPAPPAPGARDPRAPVPRSRDRPSGPIPRVVVGRDVVVGGGSRAPSGRDAPWAGDRWRRRGVAPTRWGR